MNTNLQNMDYDLGHLQMALQTDMIVNIKNRFVLNLNLKKNNIYIFYGYGTDL